MSWVEEIERESDSKKDGTLTDKSTDEKEKAVREVCELVSA